MFSLAASAKREQKFSKSANFQTGLKRDLTLRKNIASANSCDKKPLPLTQSCQIGKLISPQLLRLFREVPIVLPLLLALLLC